MLSADEAPSPSGIGIAVRLCCLLQIGEPSKSEVASASPVVCSVPPVIPTVVTSTLPTPSTSHPEEEEESNLLEVLKSQVYPSLKTGVIILFNFLVHFAKLTQALVISLLPVLIAWLSSLRGGSSGGTSWKKSRAISIAFLCLLAFTIVWLGTQSASSVGVGVAVGKELKGLTTIGEAVSQLRNKVHSLFISCTRNIKV